MRRLVSFEEADTRALPFQEDCFDVVVCGGALSFVVEKGIALREIRRTLRPWGFICVSPLFYHTVPPETLVEEISDILGFPIPVWGAEDWEKLFLESDLEVYYKRKVKLMPQSEDRIEGFARMLAAKDHLPASRLVRRAVYERSLDLFRLFNRNHAYLSFLLGILRNRGEPEEMELFVAPWDTYP
jgi:SAM-dependent methyltransferase